MRIVFHIDMDAFFASIEVERNPALVGKPVIIGGMPNQRGVVSTCSYEARVFGVRSAMSLTEAYRRCPQGIFLRGNYSLYQSISQKIVTLFQGYSPYVEVVSVDEAYLDLTEKIPHYDQAETFGRLLKQEVWNNTRLTCSIGIAPNKLLAKIASSLAKPNGLFSVPSGQETQFLAPLPIQTIPGIGRKTQEFLNREGIETIADLQKLGSETLIQRYGAHGYYFYLAASGKDDRPVDSEDSDPKSLGAETTFDKDESDSEVLLKTLQELTVKVCRRLQAYKMHTRGVTLKLRFSDFTTINRSHLLLWDTNKEEMIYQELLHLFRKNYLSGTPIRLIGISLEKLKSGYWQPSLWES